jgi:hypothetical protein
MTLIGYSNNRYSKINNLILLGTKNKKMNNSQKNAKEAIGEATTKKREVEEGIIMKIIIERKKIKIIG